MIEDVKDTLAASLARYSEIIDVRSPAEFALDHIPGAINLPVLDNEQRKTVGTMYVQQSKFLASRVGAAMVSRNIASYLEGHLADKPGSYAPLIYCWRGGNRSGAMATILSRVGWRVGLLQGGYKTYRRAVMARLYGEALPLKLVVLGGATGSGKTVMLQALAKLGVQIIDLEALAAHRGSLFGGLSHEPQPGQKLFESRLLQVIDSLDPARPVVIEAESSRVGDVMVPPALWQVMVEAPRIELQVPAAARARHIAEVYHDIAADKATLDALLQRLPRHHSKADLEHWRQLGREGQAEALALALIEAHYDPAYQRSGAVSAPGLAGTLVLADLSADELDRGAHALRQMVQTLYASSPQD